MSENRTLQMALALAEAGFRVFRCHPHRKTPATTNGFKDATTDERQIKIWFSQDQGYNLAIPCGPQPNGLNLVAIDVDPDRGGIETWDAWLASHAVPETARHRTPSGGFHVFWNATVEVPNGVSRIGPGIDVRGTGGYVLVPPSVAASKLTGELLAYETERLLWVGTEGSVTRMPGDLQASCLPQVQVNGQRSPMLSLVSTGDSVADLARDGWDWLMELQRDGWTLDRVHGQDSEWTRPGKDPRLGTSATLHGGGAGPLVVWSTALPSGGKRTAGGVGESFSPWDYIVTFRAGGDTRVAARLVRGVVPDGRASTAPPLVEDTSSPLYLDAAWYEQRPWMSACLQMAQAVGGSPSAHLLAFLTRWATLIPPGYSIPPINGSVSSFDLLSVIAGTSGSGKTSPMHNAEDLLPIQRTDLRMGLGLGSGEGIIEAFYGMVEVEDDKGKKHKERRKVIAGVNFAVSEGLIFAELAGRGGTTHVTRLCDAWSGSHLSTANASAETFRHIERGQFRLTLMMGIQADMAHQLMNDSTAAQGFVGRLLFCWAEEPRVTPRPQPPASLSLPVPPKIASPSTRERPEQFMKTMLSYPPEVYEECQRGNDARVGTKVPVEEHHHDLLRLKLAGIAALMDGRLAVNLSDWRIATDLANTSRAVRNYLYESRRLAQRDLRHANAEARGEAEFVAETAKERRAIIDYKAKVLGRLRTDGPLPYGTDRGLGKMAKSDRRWMVRRAVDELEDEGAIRKAGDHYELA